MNIRPLILVGGAIIVGMLALSAWAWPQVPADAQIPVHWGPGGQPDGYGPKWLGLLGLPAVALAVLALLAFLPRFEPRRANLARSSTAYVATGIAALALLGVIHAFAVATALGGAVSAEANIIPVVGIGAGLLFIVIGNYLGKTRSSWFFGIRTPWTLSSERSWSRTHRLGGYLFIALGVTMLLAAVLLSPEVFIWLVLIGVPTSVALLAAYSYFVWRDDPERQASS